MAEEKDEEKKIFVDEDWKKKAQEDKKISPPEEKAEKEQPPRGPMPPGNFAALVSMLVTQGLFAMGLIQIEGQQPQVDLELAKYNIDMLQTLQEKTKGNLSKQEEVVLTNTLHEVRMAFVKVTEHNKTEEKK
jgi:hypothetical protein